MAYSEGFSTLTPLTEAAYQALPVDPLNLQSTQQLHSGHEEEKAELLDKVNRLRETEYLCNNKLEVWFSKYMQYKGLQKTTITALLQKHFPLSHIAGHNLAQDKFI